MKRLEILDLPEDTRRLVAECEVTGGQTLFARQGRPVAMLVSFDEYMALRETIDIASSPELRAQLERAEGEVARGALMLVEELLEG